MKAWSWKRGSVVVSLLALFAVSTMLTGCLGIPEGVNSNFTLPGPNGQQIAGNVDSSFTDGDKIITVTLTLDKNNKTCSFNPEKVLVKKPSADSTTSFQTTLLCDNQQSTVKGEVDQQGDVSLTVSGWTS